MRRAYIDISDDNDNLTFDKLRAVFEKFSSILKYEIWIIDYLPVHDKKTGELIHAFEIDLDVFNANLIPRNSIFPPLVTKLQGSDPLTNRIVLISQEFYNIFKNDIHLSNIPVYRRGERVG
jgi:hypothetical protein